MNGKTPAEVVGIDLNLGEKKVENLLRQSLKKDNEKEKVVVKKKVDIGTLDQYF